MLVPLNQSLANRRARKDAEAAHRREMELRHGWRPYQGPTSVSTSYHGGGSVGIALGGLFVAVAIVVVGVAVAVSLGDPEEWVRAYWQLDNYRNGALTASWPK